MKVQLQAGIVAVAFITTFTVAMVVRHIDRGYVQYVEGDMTQAESLLIRRGQEGDGLAAFIAGGLVDKRSNGPVEVCRSRQLYAMAAENGLAEARSDYVMSLLKLSDSPAVCEWQRQSLERLIGSDNGSAALMLSVQYGVDSCGGSDPQTSLTYLLLARMQGLTSVDSRIDPLAALPGTSMETAEAEARKLLGQSRPPVDWPAIRASEPLVSCPRDSAG